MSTETTPATASLVPILQKLIRSASHEDETSHSAAPNRYWRSSSGDVKRTKEFYPFKGWRSFIVNTTEAGVRALMCIECSISQPQSPWTLNLKCEIALSCPQRNVPRLIDIFLSTRVSETNEAIKAFLLEEIQQIASTAPTLAADERAPNSGYLGQELNSRLERKWGLTCDLKFEIKGRDAIKKATRTASVSTRLEDHWDPLPIHISYELDDRSNNELLAIASASHLDDLDGKVCDEIGKFYLKQVHLDDLYDPTRLPALIAGVEPSFASACAAFGRSGSLMSLGCSQLPEIPCHNPEILQNEVPSVLLSGQTDSMTINYSVVLQVVKRSAILRATKLQPGLRLPDIAHQEIVAIITRNSQRWTVEDLLNNHDHLERELEENIQSWAFGYGVTASRFRFRTPLDRDTAKPDQAFTLCNEFFQTGLSGIAVRISAIGDFTLLPSQRNRAALDLRQQLESESLAAIKRVISNKTPDVIVKFWNSPDPQTALPVSEEIKAVLGNVLRKVTDNSVIQLELPNREQFAAALDQITAIPLQFPDIELRRNGEILPTKVALTGRVMGLTSAGWTDLMTAVTQGKPWEPTKALFLAMPRLCTVTFEAAASSQSPEVSRWLAVLQQTIREQFDLSIQFDYDFRYTNQTITLLDETVETGTPEVPVHLCVMADVELNPLSEAPVAADLAYRFTRGIVPVLRSELKSREIEKITAYWEVPEVGKRPLKDQLAKIVRDWLNSFGRISAVTVGIHGVIDAGKAVDRLKQTTIKIENVALTRSGVPISVMAVVTVRPTRLNDMGWRKLYTAIESGTTWDATAIVTNEVSTAIQDAFEVLTSLNVGNRPSKAKLVDDLCGSVAEAIAETVGILAEFTIKLDSPPEVVEYFRRAAETRKKAVDDHYEWAEKIRAIIRAKKDERLIRLGNGQSRSSPDVLDLQDTITELEKELDGAQEAGVKLESTFADAQWLLLVLSAPGSSNSLVEGEKPPKELSEGK